MNFNTKKYITENQLVSCMNNTKWRELVRELSSIQDYLPQVNIKLITDENNNGLFSAVWWDEVEQDGFELIEWMKINPIRTDIIGKLVKPHRTDYSNLIRIGIKKHTIRIRK